MSTGKITICMGAFNAEPYIARSIESLLSQTFKNFELYIVDDASQDRTLVVIKKYLKDRRVNVVSLKNNVGLYAAKNLVLKNFCRGKYWAHQDADDWCEKDRLAKQLEYLNINKLDGCGCAIDEIYDQGIKPRIPCNRPLIKNHNDDLMHRMNYYQKRVIISNVALNVYDLSKLKISMDGSLLFKTKNIIQLGGFDGTTRLAGDTELLWRFILFNRLGNIPEVLYHRRFHASSDVQNPFSGYDAPWRKEYMWLSRNRFLVAANLIKKNRVREAKQLATYNLYYPPVAYRLINYFKR